MLQRPISCSGCALNDHHLCSGFVPPFGTGSLGVMIIGEAAGEHEARESRPFVPKAQAGSVLARALKRMALDEQQFSIINVLSCRPQGNRLEGEWYEQSAIDHCRQYIDQAVERFRPRAILALGNAPLRATTGLSGQGRTVSALRGYCLPSQYYTLPSGSPVPVVASYHPSFIARGAEEYLGVLMHDIGKAIRVAQGKLIEERDFTFNLIETKLLKYWSGPQIPNEKLQELQALSQDLHHIIPYDVETPYTKGKKAEDEYDDNLDDQVIQIQFGLKKGEALILPWDADALAFTQKIMAGRAATIGHNAFRFDYKKLVKAGVTAWGGRRLDSMTMFHHLQPDLPAALETVATFYGGIAPWKYLETLDPTYGAMDVDVLFYILEKLPEDMRKRGVWDSYCEFILNFQPLLERMQNQGIRIDLERRAEFKAELETEEARVNSELQLLVPKSVKPFMAYKVWPADTRPFIEKFAEHNVIVGPKGGRTLPTIKMSGEGSATSIVLPDTQRRFLVELYPHYEWRNGNLIRVDEFLPNSWQHIKKLILHYGEKVPKGLDDDETTEAPELLKLIEKLYKDAEKLDKKRGLPETTTILADRKRELAKELELSLEVRKLHKMDRTYVTGWKVGPDSKVHTTFSFRSATWQLTALKPNVQNGPAHGALAEKFQRLQVASPGRTLLAFDYGGCHLKTLAFEMEDLNYYRMACIDGHSSIGLIAMKFISPEKLFEMSDEEWSERVAWFRSDPDRERLRNKQFKPSLLGIQLGLMGRKLYSLHSKSFNNAREAQGIIDLIKVIFPKIPKWQQYIKDLAHRQGFLLSRYGGIRWFWSVYRWDAIRGQMVSGEDAEAALAFFVQNGAFGKKRESMLDLAAEGLDAKYGMNNDIHDASYFDCPNEYVDEARVKVKQIMESPARKLVNATFPNGLVIQVDCKLGPSLGELKKVNL